MKGEITLSPPKIVVTCIKFQQLNFLVVYGHYILDFFLVLSIFDSLKFYLINYFKKFNKH
jgi:hypothetical protein